ncbi:hypothetical protein [Desulfobacterium sp. N47]|uniref:Uncharacterized protein n=1 Tax=uncultured Desulfobacterium sp. TaxID=201089 RepID=E1Y9A6_9BACT|nr:unknown protein [uncultured Desulfobacterium sp.]
MSALLHVTIKDIDNSGYVWDVFYCPDCLEKMLTSSTWLEVIRQVKVTPQYLSHLYPQLVNEPVCDKCHSVFKR